MNDETGPLLAKAIYKELLNRDVLDLSQVPYALDSAVRSLRSAGYKPHQWASFVHFGA
jgi:hypothetical protein